MSVCVVFPHHTIFTCNCGGDCLLVKLCVHADFGKYLYNFYWKSAKYQQFLLCVDVDADVY